MLKHIKMAVTFSLLPLVLFLLVFLSCSPNNPMEEEAEEMESPPPGFLEQASYAEDCRSRPAGSVCLGFPDSYVWLIYDSVQGWDQGGSWHGNEIVVALGFRADYYHILQTNLVKTVSKP